MDGKIRLEAWIEISLGYEKKSKLRPDSSNKFKRTKYKVLLRIIILASSEELGFW